MGSQQIEIEIERNKKGKKNCFRFFFKYKREQRFDIGYVNAQHILYNPRRTEYCTLTHTIILALFRYFSSASCRRRRRVFFFRIIDKF